MIKRKYERWGEFLKAKRQAKFRSAREFCGKEDLGISYPQYSRYEAGDQLPSLEHALRLCELLNIPLLEGLLEWNRAQIQLETAAVEVDQLLSQVRAGAREEQEALAKAQASMPSGLRKGPMPLESITFDEAFVFNRAHLKMFASDPIYRDIFTYVNSFAPEWISSEEIAKAMKIELAQAEEMLEKLNDLGVIVLGAGRCRATKNVFYFPDDPEFFDLRNVNMEHNFNHLMTSLTHEQIEKRNAFRGLLTREFNADQMSIIVQKLEEVVNAAVRMPASDEPSQIYSLCILMGERFRRPEVKAIEGEVVDSSSATA